MLSRKWYEENKRKKRGILREKAEVYADGPFDLLHEQRERIWGRGKQDRELRQYKQRDKVIDVKRRGQQQTDTQNHRLRNA